MIIALKIRQSISKKKILLILGIIIISVSIIIGSFFSIRAIVRRNKSYNDDVRCTIQGHVFDQYGDGVAGISFVYNDAVIYTTSSGGRFLIDNVKKGNKLIINCDDPHIVLPYTEYTITEDIYITDVSNGLIIEVTNNNPNKKTITLLINDKNNSPISGVTAYSNNQKIGTSNLKGLLEISLSDNEYDIELRKTGYYFKSFVLTEDDVNTIVNITGNYIANTITTTNAIIFYFRDAEGNIYKNLDINYLSYENNINVLKETFTTTGSYAIVDKYKYDNFTVYSTLANNNEMYYFVDEIYFANQTATFNLKEGYKVEIEIDVSIDIDQIYLESTDNSTDKVYVVKEGKLVIYTDDLNYNFYTILSGSSYGGKLNLYDENGNIVTQINSGYEKLILK